MKNIIAVAVILGAIALAFFLGRGCSTDDITDTVIKELKARVVVEKAKAQSLNRDIFFLVQKIDSLMELPPEIEKQIVYLQAEVDSAIAQDSLNAIPEYRKGLNLLDIRTESTPKLTLYEIGSGARVFRETYGLRLKVNSYLNIIDSQDALIGKQENLLEIKDNVLMLDSLTIEAQDLLIHQLDGFFVKRFGLYGGVGMSYDGYKFAPSIQLGVGIFLWRN